MAVGPAARQPAARSQALDDLIMGTNNSSIVSKRSVERLYYPNEPHFFRYFVNKFQRRAPLINRGYWLRLRAVDVVVRHFLTRPSSKGNKVIINLGCGSDVLPWQCHARHRDACESALFVDVDYPDLMRKKRAVVLGTPQLSEILGKDPLISDSDHEPLLLRSDKYCQLGCDLRQLDSLRKHLDSFLNLADCEILFVAEVSVTYMDTPSADSLLQWASTIGQGQSRTLIDLLVSMRIHCSGPIGKGDHILPHGSSHPFAQTMLRHFDKLKTPLRSVGQYPTLESQRSRFLSRGWRQVDIWDLWEAWSSDQFLTPLERTSLDDIEPFDEWEEFMLFARHYFVAHASASPSEPAMSGPERCSYEDREVGIGSPLQIEVTRHGGPNSPRRRFGNTTKMYNAIGQQFAIHMNGMGSTGRADTYDVYAIGQCGEPPRLPLTGPLPRMCSIAADLGDYGVLLAGGRGSPANAISDSWILKKGTSCCWQATWDMPAPLYRHAVVRLGGSSLVLVFGGKMGVSRISNDSFVFHPERGWLRCDVRGRRPEPAFGAILCNSSNPGPEPGVFRGLLAGGMSQDGQIVTRKYLWCLDTTHDQPVISFEETDVAKRKASDPLSLFGAEAVDFGSHTMVCGGMGGDSSIQGQAIIAVAVHDEGYSTVRLSPSSQGPQPMPFMIGSSVVPLSRGLVVLGGGATCFSMGTFWDSGAYKIDFPAGTPLLESLDSPQETASPVGCIGSLKVVSSGHADRRRGSSASRATTATVPRVRLHSAKQFRDVLLERKPVVIEGLSLGDCVQKWQPSYMVDRVGQKTEVTVHECERDTEKMDFNSKNFRYVKDTFGAVVERMEAGGRLYLRSLSQDKPSQSPANVERDFPALAADFKLPEQLDYVREHMFSSVLRMSGRVNMWLHYDVMANIYSQIRGAKRMVVFPPGDVTRLRFAAGASSSSLDVLSGLETEELGGTHPHEAVLSAGDVLFLPAMWLHTATPETATSVAVNTFFRDLEGGYAAGRDVYGNRDLGAYERGRQDVARISRSFEGLPADVRGFYMARLADELQQQGGGGGGAGG